MKARIFISIVIVAVLIGGLFLPTKSGLTDEAEPESNPITVFHEVEEERQAEEESIAEEEAKEEQNELISTLSQSEQEAYSWAALRSDPESLIMTPERTAAYTTSLYETTSLIDIYSTPAYSETDIKGFLADDLAALSGITGIDEAKANQNADGAPRTIRLGLITTRTSLKALPSDDEAVPKIETLTCSTPVWILHISKDSLWSYVQAADARGWVLTTDVASASSEEVWQSYVNPESKAVVSAASVQAGSATLDMGSMLALIDETPDEFTVLLPNRRLDGSVEASEVTISRDDASLGVVDYTWTHLFKQLYQYSEGADDIDTADMIVNVYRAMGITLPHNLAENLEGLGTVTELADLDETALMNAFSSLASPALIEDADGISVFLGIKEGEIWKYLIEDGKGIPKEVAEPLRMVMLG